MLKRRDKIAAAGATVAVVVVTALGFFLSGSPQTQRLISADARRVDDLSAIAIGLHLPPFVNALPASLSELGGGLRLSDPLTNAPYEYHRGEGTKYSLCATFSLATRADGPQEPFWEHPAGHRCYSLDSSEQPALHVRGSRPY